MSTQNSFHNDLPTHDDKLEWKTELDRIAERILNFPTPHVLGIHGDWGSGKTSFMRQLQHNLGGDMPKDASVGPIVTPLPNRKKKTLEKEVVTIWFDAWRYQNESVPILALLQEIRLQMAALPAVIHKFKKIGEIAAFSLIDSLSDIGKAIGFEYMPSIEKIEKRGEKWEKEHHAETLATNSIREHLHKTIKCLLPSDGSRIVIFIDDLDRCNPKAAMRLLEGLKIYMSIPDCVFVLGMNERILVDAIREEISAPKDTTAEELKLRASHYLEKICTDIYRIPLPISSALLLGRWMQEDNHIGALQLAVGNVACLPPNPRKLKALANQWSRFSNCIPFPAEIAEQGIWAVRVLVASYIHQFHRDLWERWHFNFDFWREISDWCSGKIIPDWSVSLKMPHKSDGFDEVSSQPKIKRIYLNPGDIDNFWIGALIFEYRDALMPKDFVSLLRTPGVTV
jgi:hypothetical protein